MMQKASVSAADFVLLDLEDAVAPASKEEARRLAARALNELDWGSRTRAVRVNGTDSAWCADDIYELMSEAGSRLDVVILPKARSPRDVHFVDTLLDQLEQKCGLPRGRIGLEVLIEETEALARVEEIAASSPRIEALVLGMGDLAASQGMRGGHIGDAGHGYPGDVWHHARSRMIVAARANGLDPIDGAFADFSDGAGFRREAEWAAMLGAVGKWAIHPSQIEIANDVFSPTTLEADEARAVVAAMDAAERAGHGGASLDGKMIDAATARTFSVVARRADAIAARDPSTGSPG